MGSDKVVQLRSDCVRESVNDQLTNLSGGTVASIGVDFVPRAECGAGQFIREDDFHILEYSLEGVESQVRESLNFPATGEPHAQSDDP